MSLTLVVDVERWRAAHERACTELPGIVPVVKGNGYGFGRELLCREAQRLAVPVIAVGTYAELPDALAAFGHDVLVLEPYRPPVHGGLSDLAHERVLHTLTSSADVADLRDRAPGSRVVVEGLTSMNRFGAPVAGLGELVGAAGAEGATLHLPLGTGHVAEISRFVEAAPQVTRWYVSHVTGPELLELARRFPDRDFLPRVGTALWLADRTAYEVRAHVLDVRPVARGDRAGYRQRRLPAGHLVVVSGGTSHGVAMESPAAAATVRSRAVAVAEGLLEAAHRVRSPFTVSGTTPRFAEPPHMQCSLLALPAGVPPPEVGDTVPVRMRLTTAYPDAVELA
ncbi:MAG TPA: alanine racemase [Intrasporangium sp.]|uniref:alanine racemase n=1 Tax=Intrasporangium sp. TaxID=1925024 RepID=UPI002D7A00BA|nr:alanine racemase [Intrasporangium sp.]HET7398071.1 alanine racemase [Intrasporangium sp.]